MMNDSRIQATPSVQHAIERIYIDLVEHRKNVLVLLPAGISGDTIWELLRADLARRDYDVRELTVTQQTCTELEALSECLDIPLNSSRPWTLESLLSEVGESPSQPDLLHIAEIDQLDASAQATWMRIIAQWVSWTHSAATMQYKPLPLCAIMQASCVSNLPDDNVYLAVHHWWGSASITETRILARQQSLGGEAVDRWREHVLPALAGSDVATMESLWDTIAQPISDVIISLRHDANNRGWTQDKLIAQGAFDVRLLYGAYQPLQLRVPPQYYELWASGALQVSQEYGFQLHPAALVCLKREDLIRHRIWRGQMPLVMDVVNHIRLTICEAISLTQAPGWALALREVQEDWQRDALEQDHHACELSHLSAIITNSLNSQMKYQWKEVINRANKVRNVIAHYQPIEFSTFQELWDLHQNMWRTYQGQAKKSSLEQ